MFDKFMTELDEEWKKLPVNAKALVVLAALMFASGIFMMNEPDELTLNMLVAIVALLVVRTTYIAYREEKE